MRYTFSSFRPVPVAIAAVMLAVSATGAHAQSNTGALRGEVRDATGAKVKDATVTLTNLGTKIARTATTNDAGIYQFSAVDPGDYKPRRGRRRLQEVRGRNHLRHPGRHHHGRRHVVGRLLRRNGAGHRSGTPA